MTTQTDSSARAAEAALGALGVRCRVEARGNLAVVIPGPGDRSFEDAGARRAALAALRAQGFTHAAVELPDDREPATEFGPLAG